VTIQFSGLSDILGRNPAPSRIRAAKLDFQVSDHGEQGLKNIAQPIHVFRVLEEEKPMPKPAAFPLPDTPPSAVLPFQNMSGEPEQQYFADGMVEEIITARLVRPPPALLGASPVRAGASSMRQRGGNGTGRTPASALVMGDG